MSRVCPECGQEYPDGTDRCPEDGAKTFVVGSGDDLVGKRIDDRFTITSLLGKGGMGAVYRAHQHSMDREVALKVMRRDLASVPDAVKRFFREAKAASKLHNPHAITVFDFGQTDDGLLYIVMELLFGQSLAEVVKKTSGPMDPKRAINIVLQVLTALADAHAIGVLHRDLKPDNIFLMDGEATNDFVKVLDFGIAKILGSDGTSLTGTGMLFGTPTYMSPEQATGEELDTRSDLYAVGVILFELLAGKPPFQEKTPVALLVKKANENAPSIFHVNPEVKIPKGLERVVAHLLASKPEDRPADAKEVMGLFAQAGDLTTEPGVPMPAVMVRHGTTEIVSQSEVEEEALETESTTETPRGQDSMTSIPPDRKGVPWKIIVLALGLLAGVLGLWYVSGEPEDSEESVPLTAPDSEPVQVPGVPDALVAPDEGRLVTGLQLRAQLDAYIAPDPDVSNVVVDAMVSTKDILQLSEPPAEKPEVSRKSKKKAKKPRPAKRKSSTRNKMSDRDKNVLKMLRRDRGSGTRDAAKPKPSGKTGKDTKVLDLLRRNR